MKFKINLVLSTVLFCAISVYSIAAVADVETQTFDLKDIKSLTFKINHADITLTQGKSKELKITLSQELKRGDEDVCLHKINHSISSDKLEVFTKAKKHSAFSNCSVKRSVHILLDQSTLQNLHVHHSHGSFSADSLTPTQLSLDISHSKITLADVASDTAELDFDHTNLEIDTLAARQLEIKGAHGATHINEVSGEKLVLKRAHGNVKINRSEVDQFTLQQSHGSLTLKTHRGTELSLQTAHGSLAVNEAQAENVELYNSHGSISYSGSSNTLRFSNRHGPTEIEQSNTDFNSIEGKAAHGSVNLALPKGSLCELEISSLKKASADMFRRDGECEGAETRGHVKVRTTHGNVRTITNNYK